MEGVVGAVAGVEGDVGRCYFYSVFMNQKSKETSFFRVVKS